MVLHFFSSIVNMIKNKGQLVSWSDFSVEDITFLTSTYYVRSFTSKLNGKIYTNDGRPMIQFSRESSGMNTNGSIRANSSDFSYFIGIVDDGFTIVYNEKLLGNITPSGEIFNADGELIGSAKHPLKVSLSVSMVKIRFAEYHFPIHLNNEQVASIFVSPTDSFDSVVVVNENSHGETVVKLHRPLTDEEEKWLIALAIIEVVYHGHWIIGV